MDLGTPHRPSAQKRINGLTRLQHGSTQQTGVSTKDGHASARAVVTGSPWGAAAGGGGGNGGQRGTTCYREQQTRASRAWRRRPTGGLQQGEAALSAPTAGAHCCAPVFLYRD